MAARVLRCALATDRAREAVRATRTAVSGIASSTSRPLLPAFAFLSGAPQAPRPARRQTGSARYSGAYATIARIRSWNKRVMLVRRVSPAMST